HSVLIALVAAGGASSSYQGRPHQRSRKHGRLRDRFVSSSRLQENPSALRGWCRRSAGHDPHDRHAWGQV
ncbi:MAG: hypothetical protein LBV40_02185, partial [Methanomicrobiales archaeon]|nr:hypothetical protein [Methanomicrobiales archaeon]